MINWSLWTLSGRFIRRHDKKLWTWTEIFKLWLLASCDSFIFLTFSITVYIVLGWRLLDTPHTPFSCADLHIKNPLYPNTVSTLTLLFCTLFLPSLCVVGALFIAHAKFDKSTVINITAYSVYSFLDYALCYWAMTLILEVLKCMVGRLRPNFLAMCKPDSLNVCNTDPLAVINDYNCTAEYKYARNSRASFPSGHSGASVFAFLFVFLFLSRKMISSRVQGNKYLALYRLVVLTLFLLFTVFCCISRITDYWHFPTDVLGGAIIGGACSLFSFTVFRKPSTSI